MKKFVLFALTLALTPLLTSCVGEEPNNIAFVTAVGIDKDESGYIYTIQFANPTKISGGASEEGGEGGEIVENIAVRAPTLYSAVTGANSIVSKDMSLSHAKVIVVSEETATEGMDRINDEISRNNDIRPEIYLAVAKDAGEYIEAVKPAVELNPVKYYQLIYENKSGAAVPRVTAFDFFTACRSGDIDGVLPLAGTAETGDENESSENEKNTEARRNESGFENGTESYMAGQAGKKLKNKSQTMGTAVFKGDKYIDRLGSTETELYNILMNKFRKNNVAFYSDKDPEIPITIKLEQKKAPRYRIDAENKRAAVDLTLDGELVSASSAHRVQDSAAATEELASKEISRAAKALTRELYERLDVDSLGIKKRMKKRFVTNKEYERFCADFIPSEWSFEINTDLKLRRTGLTYYY